MVTARMREMVDREREVRLIGDAVVAESPALIVMIGRRRVGKSFLLARTLGGTRTVFFQGDEQAERQHLDLFAVEAGRALIGSTALTSPRGMSAGVPWCAGAAGASHRRVG